jgi:hypothetical protein
MDDTHDTHDTEETRKHIKVRTTLVYREYYTLEAVVPDDWDYEMIRNHFVDIFDAGGMSPSGTEVDIYDIDEEPVDE